MVTDASRNRSDRLVHVSKRFLTLSLLACTLVAFAVGRTARMLLFVYPHLQFLLETRQLLKESAEEHVMRLPNPVLKNGKLPPPTLYTSKNFDTARSATIHSRWVVTEHGPPGELPSTDSGEQECNADNPNECSTCRGGKLGAPLDGQEEVHLPVGQHLLMDIRNVDQSFLASEERLAMAMLDVVGECGLTLLSYHCHGLHPAGVSCVGVLLESHVSFHTWPAEGVITLDLFTCGPSSLLPIVPKVEQLFSVPRPWAKDLVDMPEAIWAYKWRGYGEQNKESKAELTDLFTFPIGAMTEYKKEIASVYIGPDRIDIYDVLRSPYQTLMSYKRMLQDRTSYEAQHPQVFEPDRIVFTNGVLQSRRSSGAAFYEMFVHPALFAHENPKRVAVIGFGDGAILRETLKHKSVEQVVVIDYDEALLNLTMTHFPEYHDCSFLEGNNKNCLKDPRVTTYYGDAVDWFDDQSSHTAVIFDVIIVDDQEYITQYQETSSVLQKLYGAMADNGVLVASLGFAHAMDPVASDMEMTRGFLDALVTAGFASVRDYEEGHLGFEIPWRFAVAFKTLDTMASWFRNEATMNIEIRQRIIPTADGSSTLAIFDGAVQQFIMYPSRISEIVFCKENKPSKNCEPGGHGFDPELPHLSSDTFLEAKSLDDGKFHVIAKEDISFPSYVGLDAIVRSIHFPPMCYKTFTLVGTKHDMRISKVIVSLNEQYFHHFTVHGETEATIPSTLHIFVDHGCGGSSNFGIPLLLTESEAFPDSIPDEIIDLHIGRDTVYNPAADRQPTVYNLATPLRAVKQGEEIRINKLTTTRLDSEGWKVDVVALQQKCSTTKQ